MIIKSDKYNKVMESNKWIAVILVLLGAGLMVFALISPLVEGILAIILFFIGYGIFETPYEKLTEDM